MGNIVANYAIGATVTMLLAVYLRSVHRPQRALAQRNPGGLWWWRYRLTNWLIAGIVVFLVVVLLVRGIAALL